MLTFLSSPKRLEALLVAAELLAGGAAAAVQTIIVAGRCLKPSLPSLFAKYLVPLAVIALTSLA